MEEVYSEAMESKLLTLARPNLLLLEENLGGPWVAQSVKHWTLAEVTILRFMSLSLTLGSVLTAKILEPASDSVSPPLSLPLPCSRSVSLSLKNNK